MRLVPRLTTGHSIGPAAEWPAFGIFVVAIGIAAFLGCVASVPGGAVYLVVAIAVAGSTVLAFQPRWALYALLVILPVAAVPGILLQQSGWPTLLKDAFIIVPLYIGTLAAGGLARFGDLPKPITRLLLALAAFVLVMSIRSFVENPIVALIGLKTWLWYLPMLVVPFVCVRDFADVWRILRLMVVIAPLPGIVAIIEAVLIYGGNRSTVYGWYGSLAGDVTQNFAAVNISSSLLVQRIPSTFDFPSQFFGFSLAMLPICLALAMVDPSRKWRAFGTIAVMIVAVGGVLSGARSFLTLLPLDLILTVVFVSLWRARLLVLSAGALATLALVGSSFDLGGIATFIGNLTNFYLFDTTAKEFGNVWAATGGIGMGVGTQTGASRYVLGGSSGVGIGIEGWYAKVLFELGVAGLILVLALWTALLGHLWSVQRRARPPAQVIASLILILSVSVLVNLIKGPYIDLDPLNVYFWLMVGLGIRIAALNSHIVTERRS